MALSTRVAQNKIMAHMIPFYPNETLSFEVVEALIEGGVSYLEIQFPFTDPTADGPTIEAASQLALKSGFTVDKGFAFIRTIRELCDREGVPIFIMTYASLAVARGVERFVADAKNAGAQGLIIPDLPLDGDEGLYVAAAAAGIEAVPVVVPGIAQYRIDLVYKAKPRFVYCALRSGITGSATSLDDSNLGFLRTIAGSGANILGGFGISSPDHIRTLRTSVHASVVGSAFVRAISKASAEEAVSGSQSENVYDAVKKLAVSLVSA